MIRVARAHVWGKGRVGVGWGWGGGTAAGHLSGPIVKHDRGDKLRTLVWCTRVSFERVGHQLVSPSDGRQHTQRSQILPKLLVRILVLRLKCEEHLVLGHDVHITVACQQASEVVEPPT